MNTEPLFVKSAPRFIVLDAPGCFGTFATIYSSHETIEAARRAKGRSKRLMISTDGGWAETHKPGSHIHQPDMGAYERLD